MQKALLKDQNMDLIIKMEDDYFAKNYGTMFEIFHESNITPILNMESIIIHNLQK